MTSHSAKKMEELVDVVESSGEQEAGSKEDLVREFRRIRRRRRGDRVVYEEPTGPISPTTPRDRLLRIA